MALKKGNEIPTIDVVLVTVKTGLKEYALDTASKIGVNVQTETTDAVKLIVKGRLITQKNKTTTITGNTIVLTDNVFNPELVQAMQGGEITYWSSGEHTETTGTDAGFGVASYTPPVSGSDNSVTPFTLCAYSAVYNAAGLITGYEKIEYPNCVGDPIALNSEDGVFRAPEYTINSAPDNGQPPYKITYSDDLPEVS